MRVTLHRDPTEATWHVICGKPLREVRFRRVDGAETEEAAENCVLRDRGSSRHPRRPSDGGAAAGVESSLEFDRVLSLETFSSGSGSASKEGDRRTSRFGGTGKQRPSEGRPGCAARRGTSLRPLLLLGVGPLEYAIAMARGGCPCKPAVSADERSVRRGKDGARGLRRPVHRHVFLLVPCPWIASTSEPGPGFADLVPNSSLENASLAEKDHRTEPSKEDT